MVLIFGWGGGPVQDRGDVAPIRCPNCHNDVYFHHIHSTRQVSLFFVPVMQYRTDEYLACPVCRQAMQVPAGHLSSVLAMHATTAAFRAGSIADWDYRARIDAFWRSMGIDASGGTPAAGGNATTGPASGQPGAVETPLAERLASLGRLHADGILTDDEFDAAKRQLLER